MKEKDCCEGVLTLDARRSLARGHAVTVTRTKVAQALSTVAITTVTNNGTPVEGMTYSCHTRDQSPIPWSLNMMGS